MNESIRPGAGEFFLPGSRQYGVLLIHGFTGAPPELRLLGDRLHDDGGLTVLGVRLTGHGSTVENLEQATCSDWIADVEEGYLRLARHCRYVLVCGLSLGALLAVRLAAAAWPGFWSTSSNGCGNATGSMTCRRNTCRVTTKCRRGPFRACCAS